MSFSGRIEDVAATDLFQFVQMGARSGTLVLRNAAQVAEIAFHRGTIVNARMAGLPRLGDLLVERGALLPEDLDTALQRQAAASPRPSLGQVLVDSGLVPAEAMYAAVREQFGAVVREVVAWRQGQFEFLLDDIRPVDELAIQPGDLVPQVHIDTQAALLDALRMLDEQGREPAPAKQEWRAPQREEPPPQHCVQAVTRDPALLEQLAASLCGLAQVRAVPLRDAGVPGAGEPPPLVVLDLRGGRVPAESVAALHRMRPRARIVVVAEAELSPMAAYAAGAVGCFPGEAGLVGACVRSLLALRSEGAPARPDVRRDLLKVRRVLGDLQSGLITTSISLSLMNVISESVERAVLFLVARDVLVPLGAFGAGVAGRPLAHLTQGLRLPVDARDLLGQCLGDARVRLAETPSAKLPERLQAILGPPASGQLAVLPVAGGQRVVALVYVDNGARREPIEELDVLELAAAQAGLAFENELLRRRVAAA